jgi:hypothetical protein
MLVRSTRTQANMIGALVAVVALALAMTFTAASRAEASTTSYGPWIRTPTSPSKGNYTYCRAIAFINLDSLGYVYGQGGSQCQTSIFSHAVSGQLQPLSGPEAYKTCLYVSLCKSPFVSVVNRSGSQRYCLFAQAYWNSSELQYGKATACAYY